MRGARLLSLLLLTLSLSPMTAGAYSVSLHPDSGGERIIVGPDGNFWFTRIGGLGVADQRGTVLRSIPLPGTSANFVQDLVVGPDGNIWYSALGTIGRVTLAGTVTEFNTGPPAVLNTTPIPIAALTVGPDGALWFTETGRNFIGRLTVTGALSVFAIPSSAELSPGLQTSFPEGIAAGPDGALWFSEAQTDKIGRITTAGIITEFSLPSPGARPVGITAGPDGALWFAESGGGKIGRITTSGTILEFLISGTPQKSPGQIIAGSEGAIWFTWSTPNQPVNEGGLGRITTAGSFSIFTTDAVQTVRGLPHDVVVASDQSIWFIEAGALGQLADTSNTAPALVAAVLPGSRSGVVGAVLTVFATIANGGADLATRCRPEVLTAVPVILSYATTDSATNATIGPLNTPVDIPGGSRQSFVLVVTSSAPFSPTEISFAFLCDNASAAPIISGVNTLLVSASTASTSDVIAIATPNRGRGGILSIEVPPGAEFLAVAAANLGAGDTITVSADTDGHPLPLAFTVCRSNPQTGFCSGPMTASVSIDMPGGSTATLIILATASGSIPFDAARNRVFVRFVDSAGVTRGITSLAVQSPVSVFTF